MEYQFHPARDLVIATYSESKEQLGDALSLIESLRTFGGRLAETPVWVYAPTELPVDAIIEGNISNRGGDVRRIVPPDEARFYFYATKPFAAARAESIAIDNDISVLVWLDADTVFLREPEAFILPDDIELACRPVMHNRSGSLLNQPPDRFWSRIYELIGLEESQLFAMETPADHQRIRAYFNCGIIITRPLNRVFECWATDFRTLASDSLLKKICHDEINRNIFLHQTALVGAVLRQLDRREISLLSDQYNYPIFFDQMYGADSAFDDISDVITLRYDYYFRNPEPDWYEKLHGPEKSINWLREKLGHITAYRN